jgi:hypothetical protein
MRKLTWRLVDWLARHGRALFWSPDFVLGFLTFLVVAFLSYGFEELRQAAFALGLSFLALSVTVLGVVLATVQWTLKGIDDHYERVLSSMEGGVDAAVRPFNVVAGIAACAALVNLIVILLGILPSARGLVAVAMGLAFGLVVWMLVGVGMLVELGSFHQRMKMRLLSELRETRDLAREHREEMRKSE